MRSLALLRTRHVFRGAMKTRPKMTSPAIRRPPTTGEIPNPNIEALMPWPIPPPRVAWLKISPSGWKKERIPHKTKARIAPPKNQFHRFTEAEKRFLTITQIAIPTTATNMPSPAPNKPRKPWPTLAPQETRRVAKQASTPITTISSISLRIGGEAIKVKSRLHQGWLFARFDFDLTGALGLLCLLLINCYRNDNGTAMSSPVQKFC